jgi:hypothetical protein
MPEVGGLSYREISRGATLSLLMAAIILAFVCEDFPS